MKFTKCMTMYRSGSHNSAGDGWGADMIDVIDIHNGNGDGGGRVDGDGGGSSSMQQRGRGSGRRRKRKQPFIINLGSDVT